MKKFVILPVLMFFFAIQIFPQEKHPLTVEDMWAMHRVGSFDISPDGLTIAFSVTDYNMDENSGDTDIWLINTDGSDLRPLKNSDANESNPKFSPDGKRIAYSYKGQIWTCDLNGKNDEQLTDLYTGASGMVWSNDGSKILFTSNVFPECKTQECNKTKDEEKAKSKVNARIITNLLYRHWDEWRGDKRSHLFIMDVKTKKYQDLNLGSEYDAPTIALGSGNDYSFSPKGDEVAFSMNNSKVLATSTNNDIYLVDLKNLSETEVPKYKKISNSGGSDTQPVYSPDGSYIAFTSMERAGFEADKHTIVIYTRATGDLKNISKDLDISVDQIAWTPDSKYIFYTAANEVNNSIYRINVSTGENILFLKEHVNSSLALSPDGKKIYFKQQRSNLPYEIFEMSSGGGPIEQITHINKDRLANIEMNDIETFWCEGAEGAKVQSILVKPPFFDKNKKYPLIFLIHGGPQGNWTDDFHYRWNMQMFASKGYVVVAPNPRGSTGYGQKFTDEISLDWGGKAYIDLMNSLDYALDNYNFIDKKNLFSAGASYGGYMIAWIEGHTDRFNALVCHDGVYNLESMYGSTEELWFPEWEFGGTPWESKSIYDLWSPSNYVKNFKTPILIVQGGHDYRVPETQAFEFFTAVQKMNVPSKLLYFPEENHFVLKPQNAKLWWHTIFDWFDKYKVR